MPARRSGKEGIFVEVRSRDFNFFRSSLPARQRAWMPVFVASKKCFELYGNCCWFAAILLWPLATRNNQKSEHWNNYMDAAAAYCCRYFQNENVEYILLSRSELDFAPYKVGIKWLVFNCERFGSHLVETTSTFILERWLSEYIETSGMIDVSLTHCAANTKAGLSFLLRCRKIYYISFQCFYDSFHSLFRLTSCLFSRFKPILVIFLLFNVLIC